MDLDSDASSIPARGKASSSKAKPKAKPKGKQALVSFQYRIAANKLTLQFDDGSDDDDSVEEVLPAKKSRAPAKKPAARAPAKTTAASRAKAAKGPTQTQSQLSFSRGGRGKTSNPIELSDEDD